MPGGLPAQAHPRFDAGAHAVLGFLWADPVPGSRALGEVRVTRPILFVDARPADRLRLVGMLNLEGLTMPSGELTLGAWGEGFVDRRHPHTYVHELLVSATDVLGALDGRLSTSITVGKGFAPFGTDDPMVRPPLRYPVNHHLAQILERAVAIVGLRLERVALEASLFNGDEPERPGQWPRVGGRFGDSWSGRLTAWPAAEVELQGSFARVASPEHRPGAGTDQSKWSVSARWVGAIGRGRAYGLAEWARTSEAAGFFVFQSALAEGAWTAGDHRLHYRFERTERPEEERIADFRSRRPHLENSILGTSRWTIQTLGYEFAGLQAGRRLSIRPLFEVSYGRVAADEGLFDVETFYGRNHFWSLSLAVRLGFGSGLHRMGRYGVLHDRRHTGHNVHER